jgi:hypothetical protein
LRRYISFQNSIRLNLDKLGIDKKHKDEPLELHDYIAMKDAENAAASDAETGGDANGDKASKEKANK